MQQGVKEFSQSHTLEVSIPLSRDSLCNGRHRITFYKIHIVSIPLSRDSLCNEAAKHYITAAGHDGFQSLYRGTAFATLIYSPYWVVAKVFQSLYRGTAFATTNGVYLTISHEGFQSLYRGTAFAT